MKSRTPERGTVAKPPAARGAAAGAGGVTGRGAARAAARRDTRPDAARLGRDDWLDAAYDAVAAGGFEAVRVLSLADALGITRGSFYWHFADHAELVAALIERWRERELEADRALAARATDDPVDDLLRARPDLRPVLHEAHPELAFARLNGGRPVLSKKREPAGRAERLRLLEAAGFPCPVDRLAGAARDDILDAIAVCRTAQLIAEGKALRLGAPDARDAAGLPMAIWY